MMSRTNRPPMSISRVCKFMAKKDVKKQTAVLVGTVTDDVRTGWEMIKASDGGVQRRPRWSPRAETETERRADAAPLPGLP